MLTVLLCVVVVGVVGFVIFVRNRAPRTAPPPAPPTAPAIAAPAGAATATSTPPTPPPTRMEKVLKFFSEHYSKILGPVVIIAALNLGLYSVKGYFQGNAGREYMDSYLFSSAPFWFLVFCVFGAYLAPKKGADGIKPFTKVIGWCTAVTFIFILITLPKGKAVIGIEDGHFVYDSSAKGIPSALASYSKSANPASPEPLGAQPLLEGENFAFDIATKIPDETSLAITKYFGGRGDSVVTVMKRIAYAEGEGGKQFNKDGTVLRNRKDGRAAGVFQILPMHWPSCKTKGYDVMTLDGNVGCALYVYNMQGVDAWSESAYTWRDNYTKQPEHWRYDQTPTQFLAGGRGEDEIVPIVAPISPDSTKVEDLNWSPPVYTSQRYFCWNDLNNVIPYVVRDDQGKTFTVTTGMHLTMSRYPKYMQFRSLGNEPIEIIFTRSKKAC